MIATEKTDKWISGSESRSVPGIITSNKSVKMHAIALTKVWQRHQDANVKRNVKKNVLRYNVNLCY